MIWTLTYQNAPLWVASELAQIAERRRDIPDNCAGEDSNYSKLWISSKRNLNFGALSYPLLAKFDGLQCQSIACAQ